LIVELANVVPTKHRFKMRRRICRGREDDMFEIE
jgi:hypothetical protein